MAKQGMKRPDYTDKPSSDPTVPEIQGKAKESKAHANPIVSGTKGAKMKVHHKEKPISDVYPEIDNDLARDNIENDMTEADLQGLD